MCEELNKSWLKKFSSLLIFSNNHRIKPGRHFASSPIASDIKSTQAHAPQSLQDMLPMTLSGLDMFLYPSAAR